jgi:hypothetical protein
MQYLVRKGADVGVINGKDLEHVTRCARGYTIKFLAYYDIDVYGDGWKRYYELLKAGHLVEKPQYDMQKRKR